MMFFAYDLDDYDDWRGFYYDYGEMTPGPVVEDTRSLVECIQRLDASFDASDVRAFREKFMSAIDANMSREMGISAQGQKLHS